MSIAKQVIKTTETYNAVTADVKRINLLRGGARSGKSHALLQVAIKWLWTGEIGGEVFESEDDEGNIIKSNQGEAFILRETMPALRRTLLKEFINLLHDYRIYPFVEHRKTSNEFLYKGRQINFFSLDDESKVLGSQPTWFWINEGNPVTKNIFDQLLLRTEFFCFLDYNPYDPGGWINQKLELTVLVKKPEKVNLTISTYKMNPYLPQNIVEEIEGLADTDPQLFQVYNRGEWAELTGLIYKNYKEVDYTIEGKTVLCLDFGYSDPMAMVEITLNEDTKELLVKELYYKTEQTIDDLINFIDYEGYNTREYLIIADSADPEKIQRIKKAGIRIRPAKKGKSSIRNGIDIVKQYSLLVYSDDDTNSSNIIKELSRYKWREDKEGESMEEPIDKFNHCLDGIRYGASYLHKKRSRVKLF